MFLNLWGEKNQSLENIDSSGLWICWITLWVNIFSFCCAENIVPSWLLGIKSTLVQSPGWPQLCCCWAACLGNFSWCPLLTFCRSMEWGRSGDVSRVIVCDSRFFPFAKAAPWRGANVDSGGRQMGIKSWLCHLLAILLATVFVSLSSSFLIYKMEIQVSTSRISGEINMTIWKVPGPERVISKNSFPFLTSSILCNKHQLFQIST